MYLPCISQWPPRHTDAMDAYPNCMRRPCMHPGGGCASQGANAPPRAASSGGTTRPRNAAATAASCCRASSWVSSWKPGRTHSSPMPSAVPATLGGAGDGAGVAPAGVGRGGLLREHGRGADEGEGRGVPCPPSTMSVPCRCVSCWPWERARGDVSSRAKSHSRNWVRRMLHGSGVRGGVRSCCARHMAILYSVPLSGAHPRGTKQSSTQCHSVAPILPVEAECCG